MSTIQQCIMMAVTLHDDGLCTHDIFLQIGGAEAIPRKKLFPLLKTLQRTGKLKRGSGIDSRGKLGFKWSLA